MQGLKKTYLLKHIPFYLENYPHKEFVNYHISIKIKDFLQKERTICLYCAKHQEAWEIPNKTLHKMRYYISWMGLHLEVDIFQKDLDGLTLMAIKFPNKETMSNFSLPSFCAADITENNFFTGSMLCGKTYTSIASLLRQYMGYL